MNNKNANLNIPGGSMLLSPAQRKVKKPSVQYSHYCNALNPKALFFIAIDGPMKPL
jgi:hypothetical protein